MVDKTTAKGSVNQANMDVIWRQYISAPLAAQTISGSVKGQLRARENSTLMNARMQVIIRVVSQSGTFVRGTLYGGDLTTGTTNPISEFAGSTTSSYGMNRQMPRGLSQSLSNLNIQDGDRLVIEIGYRIHTTATTAYTATGIFGNDKSIDLAEDETTTTANNPWIEFSQDITNHVATPTGMSRFLEDTFVNTSATLFASHTPELGGPWNGDVTFIAFTGDNSIRNTSTGQPVIINMKVPDSPNVDITMEIVVASATGGVGMIARNNIDITGNYYHARLNASSSAVQLYRFSTTAGNTLIGSAAWTPTLGTHTLQLVCNGTTISVFVNNSTTAAISVTDTSYSNRGYVGMRFFGSATDTTGVHVTTITAFSDPPASVPPYNDIVLATAGLVGYWKLDEKSGTNVFDAAGINPVGTNNGATTGVVSLLAPQPNNTAYSLDGVNDSVSIPYTSARALSGPHSVEVWVRPIATGQRKQVFGQVFSYGIALYDGVVKCVLWGTSDFITTYVPPLGISTYLVYVYDGSAQILYVNGVEHSRKIITGTPSTSSNPLTIGLWSGQTFDQYINAVVDEPALYSLALSPITIADHYQSGQTEVATVARPIFQAFIIGD
jgi:hypothetical protein